jgi:O-antigen ligase
MAPKMPRLVAIGTEYYLFGGAGVISLLAFAALILVPALGSYGRTWEKATAALLSLFVLAALLLLGVALGVLIVYFWDDITRILPGVD